MLSSTSSMAADVACSVTAALRAVAEALVADALMVEQIHAPAA
jgi:hypothetical protein